MCGYVYIYIYIVMLNTRLYICTYHMSRVPLYLTLFGSRVVCIVTGIFVCVSLGPYT